MEDTPESINNGRVYLDYFYLNALILGGFQLRDIRVCALIIRLTLACKGSDWATVQQKDLSVIGVSDSHAAEVLQSLVERKIIIKRPYVDNSYQINHAYFLSVTEKNPNRFEQLRALVGLHLFPHKASRGGKSKPPKKVAAFLPAEEEEPSHERSTYHLPPREVYRSKSSGFEQVKDTLERIRTTDRTMGLIGSSKNSSYRKSGLLSPEEFWQQISNPLEEAAYDAWKRLEPYRPSSFGLYVSLLKRGLPLEFFENVSKEISLDKGVEDKGKVFNYRAQEYLRERGL